jgi:hypothetical protein
MEAIQFSALLHPLEAAVVDQAIMILLVLMVALAVALLFLPLLLAQETHQLKAHPKETMVH